MPGMDCQFTQSAGRCTMYRWTTIRPEAPLIEAEKPADADKPTDAEKLADADKPADAEKPMDANKQADAEKPAEAPPLPEISSSRRFRAVGFPRCPWDVSVRITHGENASRWLIDIDDWQGNSGAARAIGLSPLVSSPPAATPLALQALNIQRGIQVSEITAHGASAKHPVTSFTTNGTQMIGVIDGVACDLSHRPGTA